VRNNTAWDNERGIFLTYNSNENRIENNSVHDNSKGISLAYHSCNNTIHGNIASENDFGVHLTFSANWNTILENHLIANDCNAFDRSANNIWDNGTIGNYYSDLGQVYYLPGGYAVDSHPISPSS
jgi:parallel beta-helix repeat protein